MPAQSAHRQRQPVFVACRFSLRRPASSRSCSARSSGATTASPTPIRRRSTMWASSSSARRSTTSISGRTTAGRTTINGNRLVFDGSIHSPMSRASTAWERLSHGFHLNALFQYYSPLPFNITTGANTIQGTDARPTINGVFINRNAGTGFDFFNLGRAAQPLFPADGTALRWRRSPRDSISPITSTA